MSHTDTLTSREGILNRLRAATAGEPEPLLPDVDVYPWPGDAVENFVSNLEGFDGRVERFLTREDALTRLREILAPEQDALIYSRISEIPGTYHPADADHVADAINLKYFLGEGEFGVGESGSVWFTDSSLGISVLGTLAEHCCILLDSRKIVGSVCEAYHRIDLGAMQYGVFFTGPSATADIEAVHITGAQGPLSFTLLLYNS